MNRKVFSLILVVIAGEAVFMPPFLIPRLYRPLMLEAWGLTNTGIGNAFAAYGIVATFSYLVGGPFADKFHPRVLIAASLVLTALAGIFLSLFPSEFSLIATYAFFGASTILLLWGALIKTVHVAGSEERRSLAMGALDAGRGLSAAVFSSVLVLLVTWFVPDLLTAGHQREAMKIVYFATALFTLLIAAGVWISLKGFQVSDEPGERWDFRLAIGRFRDMRVWLLSVVVLGSYCGYKGIDNYATYLVDVHKVDLSSSSMFTSLIFWLRPVAALAAGVLADRVHRRREGGRFLVLAALLLLGGLSQFLLAYSGPFSLAFAVVLISASFAYGLRAIYFSVFGDLHVPEHLVGTVTGIVSFVGFMPEIFFNYATGRMIDAYPGLLGFQMSFAFTGFWLILAAAASLMLYRSVK
jgi:MFS family permease